MRAETALSVALLFALAAAVPVVAAPSGEADGRATPTPDEARTVRMTVQLLPSGDANWTVATYVPLSGPEDREAFETLGRRYVNGSIEVRVDADLFRRRVAAARSAVDRPMSIGNVERDWAIRNGEGVLLLGFTWRNFARKEGERLVVDDAFETGRGTWLTQLERGQVLVIRPPSGVGFVETPRGKGVTNGTLRWEGPVTFGDEYFRIVYRTDDDTTPTPTTPPPTTPGETSPPGPSDGSPPLEAVLLVVLLGGGGVAAYLWLRRGDAGFFPAAGSDRSDEGVPTGGSDATVEGADAEPAGDDGAADEGRPAEPPEEDPFAGVDVEMLSDEERVLRLLEANGGRMKQAQIVKETDWSNAKVSQLLSRMDDDGTIDKLRVGRENLISMPDVDVDTFEE